MFVVFCVLTIENVGSVISLTNDVSKRWLKRKHCSGFLTLSGCLHVYHMTLWSLFFIGLFQQAKICFGPPNFPNLSTKYTIIPYKVIKIFLRAQPCKRLILLTFTKIMGRTRPSVKISSLIPEFGQKLQVARTSYHLTVFVLQNKFE